MTEGQSKGLRDAVEVILFTVTEPISAYQIARLLEQGGWVEQDQALTPGAVERYLDELVADWEAEGRPLTALRIAGGYQMATRPEWAGLVARLQEDHRSQRLSRAALETLAIVAYRQPVIRPDIDAIRGVNSDSALKTLLERGLVTISGRDEGPGRPLLYRTTAAFLKYFGLNSLSDMPDQEELTALIGTRLTEPPADDEAEAAAGSEPGCNREPGPGDAETAGIQETVFEQGEEPETGAADVMTGAMPPESGGGEEEREA